MIVSREAAQLAGFTTYFTGRPCLRGHVAPRRVVSEMCFECHKAQMREYHAKTNTQRKSVQSTYRLKNSQVIVRRVHQWVEANRGAARAYKANRRARKRLAQPPWVDLESLKAIYREAERLTVETGVLHSVDHDVPLKHSHVCGLHVPWNLKVMPLLENQRKYNKFEVGL